MTKTNVPHASKPAAAAAPAPAAAMPPGIDTREFRTALGSFATGVTIVTASTAGRTVGLTCNSFASVSLNPPLVLWSLGVNSTNMPAFQEATHFTVNVLAAGQADLAMKFARSGENKFAGVSWSPGLGGAPILAGCVSQFQCRTAERFGGGDHVIFLGAVEAFTQNGGAPLLFSRGKFGTFTPDVPE
jgi:flavin reductase (DIM6/NTAB) family NADH-FMN oxidoreductase RutF